jgi:hypothetical protein
MVVAAVLFGAGEEILARVPRLLARAAFEVCTGKRDFPTWRGGPVQQH